ncbi:hypothetical protein ACS0TY_024961 [Phlomoides rotata]
MEEKKGKVVCVTGGTGFLASWLIMKLLQHGYSVNATVRLGSKKDISYLTNLPGASDRLQIFKADLENPESFDPAISGCVGVFHVAHQIDFQENETEEMITNKSVKATLGILQSCLNSNTVKRVVYTSSTATVLFNEQSPDVIDETSWTDVDYIRNSKATGASYCVSKTITERVALEFAEKHCLDLVTVIPCWINGPFICPDLPGSVWSSLGFFIGNEKQIKYHDVTPFVHTDDVANAHIFLFEYPEAKGRYICSAVEISIDELSEFLSKRYPQFQMLSAEYVCDGSRRSGKTKTLSSKKLLDAGFSYKYGLEEMYDDAIECSKEKGFL